MFKLQRSNMIRAMIHKELTFTHLAALAQVRVEDLAETHLSSGKLDRIARVLGIPLERLAVGYAAIRARRAA